MKADELEADFRECLELRQAITVRGRCVPCAIADIERGDQAALDGFAPELSVQVTCLAEDWEPHVGERVDVGGKTLRVSTVGRVVGDPVVTATLEPVQAR